MILASFNVSSYRNNPDRDGLYNVSNAFDPEEGAVVCELTEFSIAVVSHIKGRDLLQKLRAQSSQCGTTVLVGYGIDSVPDLPEDRIDGVPLFS